MKNLFNLRKRVFLNPVSTGHTSYILAEAESSRNGEYKWVTTCSRLPIAAVVFNLNFLLGTKTARRVSLKKINLLIDVLTRSRDTLIKENEVIKKFEQSKSRKRSKADGDH